MGSSRNSGQTAATVDIGVSPLKTESGFGFWGRILLVLSSRSPFRGKSTGALLLAFRDDGGPNRLNRRRQARLGKRGRRQKRRSFQPRAGRGRCDRNLNRPHAFSGRSDSGCSNRSFRLALRALWATPSRLFVHGVGLSGPISEVPPQERPPTTASTNKAPAPCVSPSASPLHSVWSCTPFGEELKPEKPPKRNGSAEGHRSVPRRPDITLGSAKR